MDAGGGHPTTPGILSEGYVVLDSCGRGSNVGEFSGSEGIRRRNIELE